MEFIISTKPKLLIDTLNSEALKELSDYVLSKEEAKQILDTIVYGARMTLKEYYNIDISNEPLTGYCMDAVRECCSIGKDFDILPYKVETTFEENIYHQFAVIRLETKEGVKRYIIDPTYRQFCIVGECEESQVQPTYIAPGHFFYNKSLLKRLLRDGYFEITRSSLPCYANSFIWSAEAMENPKCKQFSLPTPYYTYEDYSSALETGKIVSK